MSSFKQSKAFKNFESTLTTLENSSLKSPFLISKRETIVNISEEGTITKETYPIKESLALYRLAVLDIAPFIIEERADCSFSKLRRCIPQSKDLDSITKERLLSEIAFWEEVAAKPIFGRPAVSNMDLYMEVCYGTVLHLDSDRQRNLESWGWNGSYGVWRRDSLIDFCRETYITAARIRNILDGTMQYSDHV